MSQLAEDLFDRADNVDLGSAWDVETGCDNFQIVGNQVRPTGASPSTPAEKNNTVTWPNDQWAEVVVKALPSGSGEGIGPAVRMAAGANSFYRILCNATGPEIWKTVAGVGNSLLFPGGGLAVGDRVRVEVVGTTIRVYVNGTLRGSVTDSDLASGSAGIAGVISGADSTAQLDSWKGGDFVNSTADSPTMEWLGVDEPDLNTLAIMEPDLA